MASGANASSGTARSRGRLKELLSSILVGILNDDDESGPQFLIIPSAQLPWPHNMSVCRYASRFKSLGDAVAGTAEAELEVGERFLVSLTDRERARCLYHRSGRWRVADWKRIAEVAVRIVEVLGTEPDPDQLSATITASRLSRRDRSWLDSLFSDPIYIAHWEDGVTISYTNGQHRGCALRFSGVGRVVVGA